jgi:tetratricopeptide (TPR) repeat protein
MRAVTLLEEAVKKDPQFALAWAALGTACAMQYQESLDERWPPRVQQANLEALRLEPDRAETRIALAQMYETTGKYDQAIDELTRAIALAPGSDTPHRLLGGLYTDLGRHDEAVRELRTAIELRPGFWRNWSYLGYAYFQAGRHEEAIPVYQRLVELQPDSARGHSAFGTVLHEMGRTAEARVHYERALSLEPTAPAWSNLGTLDFFDGRAAQAAKAYEEAVRLRPNDPTYRRNLGDAYAAMGRKGDAAQAYATARELLRAQLETNPRDADAVSTLSLIEAKLGHLDEARRLAGDALAQLPDQKDVLYHSAVVATLDARLDEAADLLTRALARGSNARHAARDPDLAPLRQRDDVRRLLVQRDEASRRQP